VRRSFPAQAPARPPVATYRETDGERHTPGATAYPCDHADNQRPRLWFTFLQPAQRPARACAEENYQARDPGPSGNFLYLAVPPRGLRAFSTSATAFPGIFDAPRIVLNRLKTARAQERKWICLIVPVDPVPLIAVSSAAHLATWDMAPVIRPNIPSTVKQTLGDWLSSHVPLVRFALPVLDGAIM
jgi:hypothetical protein